MKILKILLTSSLLLGTTAIAFSAKVEKPASVKGTSVGKYAKPGAPVDIRYESQHVNPGDTSKIDILLITSATRGTMKVKVKVDKGLDDVSRVKKNLSFDLSKSVKKYPMHLEVSADEDGLYYVRVMVSIKGQGMRAFAVPVYVGDAVLKTKKMAAENRAAENRAVEKTDKGENIAVSAAEETVTKE